jgi:hypothetical protein
MENQDKRMLPDYWDEKGRFKREQAKDKRVSGRTKKQKSTKKK